jgi:hypothetical protein
VNRYPLEPLMAAAGIVSMKELRQWFPMGGVEYRRAKQGLSFYQADRWACRLGFLPWMVWPEWLDAESVVCDEETCGRLFVPRDRHNRFCTPDCQYKALLAKQRQRYAARRAAA